MIYCHLCGSDNIKHNGGCPHDPQQTADVDKQYALKRVNFIGPTGIIGCGYVIAKLWPKCSVQIEEVGT